MIVGKFVFMLCPAVGDGARIAGGRTSDRDGTAAVRPGEDKSIERKTNHADRESHERERKGRQWFWNSFGK